jgi:nitroreductase
MTMTCPTVSLRGKTVFLLSGFDRRPSVRKETADKVPKIEHIDQLRQSARRHPDAVAFGFVAGRWMPAA